MPKNITSGQLEYIYPLSMDGQKISQATDVILYVITTNQVQIHIEKEDQELNRYDVLFLMHKQRLN